MKYAIAGGGIAALEAACAIRAAEPQAEIRMYSAEKIPPYRRPALTGFVRSVVPAAQFFLKKPEFYAENHLFVELGTSVTAIRRRAHVIELDNGTCQTYDKLILATGGRAFLPEIPGIEAPETLVLRNFSDAMYLRDLLQSGVRNIALLGGGVLSLELAESLLARECRVTVLENEKNLLNRNLDQEGSKRLEAEFRKIPDLNLRLGVSLQNIRRAAPGKLILESRLGKIAEAELLIVSAGIRPNCEIAREAGLDCRRGICVNDCLQTSDPDIFAAGDVMEHAGFPTGFYLAAKASGAAAGNAVRGQGGAFQPEIIPARMRLFGIGIFSDGTLCGTPSQTPDEPGLPYSREYYDPAGKTVGGVLIGDVSGAAALQKRIFR